MALSLNQFLMLYMWFPLVALLMFMLLIGRFFERFSGERTFFRFYFLPVIFFGIGSVRYASAEKIGGDAFGDIALGIAGILLFLLSIRLYWVMIFRR